MWRRKLDPAVAASVTERIRSVESSSSAEVVVEVRARSGSYSHADARLAAMVAFIALLIVLFSPWTFEPIWVPPVERRVGLSRIMTPLGKPLEPERLRLVISVSYMPLLPEPELATVMHRSVGDVKSPRGPSRRCKRRQVPQGSRPS